VPIGRFGDAEVFSLSPTKLLVSGEGGLVTTNDETLARIVRAQRNYGDTGSYDPEYLGLNARMTEFNAALGLTSLELTDRKVARHNEIADLYTMRLSHLPGLKFQTVAAGDVCTYKDYSIHVSPEAAGIDRDGLAASLLAENIETKKYFYPPMHEQRLYRQFAPSDYQLSRTEFVANGILSLPVYESLPDSTVEGVAVAIKRIIEHAQDQKSSSGTGY
jgi:dTDP-4-amino-4,6-dideoxygalactose transaminase